MSDSPTQRLTAALGGRYIIERELGQGGMATVYLAQDIKHERRVAIKVLKPELAAVLGAERFVVEIKTTASLQHPHILPLFDSGEADGFLYYVMPYIQGETIREKLNRESQLGIEESVRLTREVADALDYAHRRGVIHRDIKPENILVYDGRAMVMDFGIALALSAAAGGRMTETGLSLGTPHYMSPEQATAEKDLTGRSDIYSLASVCYEMLAGQPPHVGGSAQQVIMKIITETAKPVNTLRRNVPANVVAALEKALEKVPADRFENAKAFGDALATGGFSYLTAASSVSRATPARWTGRAALAGWALAIVALGLAASAWLRHPSEGVVRRYDLSFGAFVPYANNDVAVSPDGSMIAAGGSVGADRGIYLRHLDGEPEFRKVPGTDRGVSPSFSPDNQWIVFRRSTDRTLVKVQVNGGGAVVLVHATSEFEPFYPHWGDDGRIVFSGPLGDGIVDGTGGSPKPLPKVSGVHPFLLPDGSGVLYSTTAGTFLYDFKRDSNFALTAGPMPAYVSPGRLLYSSAEGGVFAVPFDLAHHRITGVPVRVLERVGGGNNAARGYAVSRDGLLIQHDAPGLASEENQLVILGSGTSADTVRLPPAHHSNPRFSPDGKRIALSVWRPDNSADLYTIDLLSGAFTQITFGGTNVAPAWSPDGKTIAYVKELRDITQSHEAEDIFAKPADNSAPERRITTMTSSQIQGTQWIDDKRVSFAARNATGAFDIFTVSTDADSKPVAYMQTPFDETEPRVSPDGKLVAYLSNESGRTELWVRDYPTPVGKWNLSKNPAHAPRWTPDGKSVLFFRGVATGIDSLFRVRIDRTPAIVVHEPELVTTLASGESAAWDLHPDGRRFLALLPTQNSATNNQADDRWLIVENWFSDLRRLTGAKER